MFPVDGGWLLVSVPCLVRYLSRGVDGARKLKTEDVLDVLLRELGAAKVVCNDAGNFMTEHLELFGQSSVVSHRIHSTFVYVKVSAVCSAIARLRQARPRLFLNDPAALDAAHGISQGKFNFTTRPFFKGEEDRTHRQGQRLPTDIMEKYSEHAEAAADAMRGAAGLEPNPAPTAGQVRWPGPNLNMIVGATRSGNKRKSRAAATGGKAVSAAARAREDRRAAKDEEKEDSEATRWTSSSTKKARHAEQSDVEATDNEDEEEPEEPSATLPDESRPTIGDKAPQKTLACLTADLAAEADEYTELNGGESGEDN